MAFLALLFGLLTLLIGGFLFGAFTWALVRDLAKGAPVFGTLRAWAREMFDLLSSIG